MCECVCVCASARDEVRRRVRAHVCYVGIRPAASWSMCSGARVNVPHRCVPKKVCHYAALLGLAMDDAKELGWEVERPKVCICDV